MKVEAVWFQEMLSKDLQKCLSERMYVVLSCIHLGDIQAPRHARSMVPQRQGQEVTQSFSLWRSFGFEGLVARPCVWRNFRADIPENVNSRVPFTSWPTMTSLFLFFFIAPRRDPGRAQRQHPCQQTGTFHMQRVECGCSSQCCRSVIQIFTFSRDETRKLRSFTRFDNLQTVSCTHLISNCRLCRTKVGMILAFLLICACTLEAWCKLLCSGV